LKLLSAIVLSFLLLFTASNASATIVVYNITLDGLQSVPANGSPATGTATVTVDDIANSVQVDMSWSGLIGGNASAAHIHCCVATNANGPVVIPFTAFPAATSGVYSNIFTGVSAANIAGIENGLAYINIHNAVFPGGEIRGNILTPEPATFGLIGAGILALLARRYLG